MNVCSRFFSAGNIESAPARPSGADENRIPIFIEQRFQAVDSLTAAKFHAEVEDEIALIIDDGFIDAMTRTLRTDHPACFRVLVEDDAMIAKWREVAGDSESSWPTTHKRNALAVLYN